MLRAPFFAPLCIFVCSIVHGCEVKTYSPETYDISIKKCFETPMVDPDVEALWVMANTVRKYKPVLSVGDWASAQVVNVVSNILLTEIMGYDTKVDFVAGTGSLYECVADGTHSFNMETWVNTKQTQREKWGKEGAGKVEETALGYNGQEAIFLSEMSKAKSKLTQQCLKPFIEAWQVLTFQDFLDLIPKDGSTAITEPYLCTQEEHTQCFKGRFIPAHCCASSGCETASPHCHEVLMASPGWNQGWYEAMISNLQLNLTLNYIGTSSTDFKEAITSYTSQDLSTLFYWFSPHPMLSKVLTIDCTINRLYY
jgi:hypothetical protein